jgi:hypothetical protein
MARDLIRIDYVLPDPKSGSTRKAPIPSLTMALLLAQTPAALDGVPVQASVHAESADGPYDPGLRRPDILCLSVLTTGAPRAYELTRMAGSAS